MNVGVAAQANNDVCCNKHLWGPAAASAEPVVRLGRRPAQEYAYARWSVAQRCDGGSLLAAELDRVLVSGEAQLRQSRR